MTAETGSLLDTYTRAVAFFGEQLAATGDNDWDLPTPCEGWDVRAVAAHVVVGESQIPAMLAGEAVPSSAEFDPGILGPNPMAAWRGTALRAIESVAAADDLLERTLAHGLGPLPATQVIGFRITDNIVHGWDIAVACSRPVELPDPLAVWSLDFWLPLADGLASSGFFAPTAEPPPDPTPGQRLLALLGRQVVVRGP